LKRADLLPTLRQMKMAKNVENSWTEEGNAGKMLKTFI
jgi:hypothetical protein